MATYYYLVLTKATEGMADEFHDWYDRQHVHDCMNIPGVKSVKRYRMLYEVGASKEGSELQDSPYDSFAIYEIESDDPMAVARELSDRAGTDAMPLTDALDRWAGVKFMAEQACELP